MKKKLDYLHIVDKPQNDQLCNIAEGQKCKPSLLPKCLSQGRVHRASGISPLVCVSATVPIKSHIH